ncbi:MAG: DUF2807 domain-containing protein [Bacteroidales bacterium]|nr:DUF2807 domain-containing protein [Bacteroidales bacterium]
MKKLKSITTLTFLFLLISSFSTGCFIEGIVGNGNVVKQERQVSSFSAIKVGGAFEVHLTQGNTESLTIEADENLMDIIETKVRNNTLIISTKESIRKSKALNLYISFKDIENLDISGAVEVKGINKMNFKTLSIEGSGASEVELKLTANELELDFSGASEIELSGNASIVELDISGAGEFMGEDLETDKFIVSISGAGNAEINVKDELEIDISGAANLKYKGNPRIVNQNVSGAGSIKKL